MEIAERVYFERIAFKGMMPIVIRTIFSRPPHETGAEHIIQSEWETSLIRGEFPVYLTCIADPYVVKIVTWRQRGTGSDRGIPREYLGV